MKKLITVIYTIFLAIAFQSNAQEVEYSFAVVGCNRVDKGDTNSVTNPSTANIYQLNRIFSEVMLLKPQPKFLFLAGDIVFGYTADSMQLERQLTAWKNLYLAHPIAASAIKLVLIPGNHETPNDKKVAIASAERTWIRIMAPYINGSNGPKPGQI